MGGKKTAETIFNAAVQAVQPSRLIKKALRYEDPVLLIEGDHYRLEEFQAIYVIGAGKASAAMAAELELLLGERITDGLIAVKHHHELPLRRIRQVPAGHPVPDEGSLRAAREMEALVKSSGERDLLILLLSGGASALIADCPAEVRPDELQALSAQLLRSGAGIKEVNGVRKHLSRLKGGRLARLSRGRLLSLIISDVVGDDLAVIGSGLTVPDNSSFEEAWQVILRYGLKEQLPATIRDYLEKGRQGLYPETVKSGDAAFSRTSNYLIGNNREALEAAAQEAEREGFAAQIVNAAVEEPVEVLTKDIVQQALAYDGPLPACFAWGGESTLEVRGNGKGGRNQHLALMVAWELERSEDARNRKVTFLSAGSDGTDGPTDMAGAVIDRGTLAQARQLDLVPEVFLENCDSYHFFSQAGGHIHTGPTQSNVMDIILLLIEERESMSKPAPVKFL